MDTYLSQTRKSLDCLSDYETIHAVLGNESADLDSVISSLVQAFYLYQITSSPKTLIVPVLNIPRSDYHLKTEAVHILKQHGITVELLTFRDDVDLLGLHNLKKLKLTLVDQNVLPNKDLPLEECVVRVIDHRPRERLESSFCNVTIEPVGSCCTLIADEIFKGSYSNQIDVTVANLLFTTILVDTINMSKDAGRGTAKDEEVLQRLEVVIPNSCREKTFKEIQDVKCDLSNLTTLDILQKDLKVISGNGTSIAMSSITMKIQDFIKREDLESSLNKFAELQATKAVVIMGIFVINGKTLRDLGVFSLSKNFQDKIIEALMTSNKPDLALEVIPYESKHLVVFSQGNNQGNRKMVLPILKTLLTSEDFSRLFKNPERESEYSHHGNSACGGISGGGSSSSSGGGGGFVIGSGVGVLEQELKRASKYSDSASSLSGTSLSGTDTSTDQFDTYSPTTSHNDSDHPSTLLDNGVFVSSSHTKPNPADHNNSHIINSENEDHTIHIKYNSNIDNVDFLNKHHQIDNFVCIQTEHPIDIATGDKCPEVREVISPGIASPMEIVSDQTSDQGSSYPVTPPNSFMDSSFSTYMKDYHLPSFNSAEMVQRIKEKKATLDIHDEPESNGTNSKNHSLHFPYTPQNSSIESEYDSSIHKTLSPDIIDDILEKINESNPHSRAAINPNYAKRSNGENLGFLSCSDFDTFLGESSDSENITDVAYSLANEIIQNSLESYPYVNKLVEPLKTDEKRLAPLVKSRSEGNTINLAIKNECPKSQSDVANLSNVLETEYARQFDPFNGALEYTHFSLDFSDYMAKRGVSESASKISSGSYSDDITVSSDSTKSDDGLIIRKDTIKEKVKTQDHSKLLDPNSLPDEPQQVSPNILMPPDSILSSIEDNLSDLTTVSPTKSNLAPDASTSDVESESMNEEDNDSDPEQGDKDFAAELREKLSQIGTDDSLLHGPENEGIFSPEELRSGIQRMSFTNNLTAAPPNQIANFSADALRQKLEKIALDENGAVGGLREFTYDSDSDSEISPSTTEGNVHTVESANPSPRPLSSGLMEVIEENEEEEEEEKKVEKEKKQRHQKNEEKQSKINVTLQRIVEAEKPDQNNQVLLRHDVPLNESPLVTEPSIEAINEQTSQSSFDTYLEPVVLRRQGNKEVFHTTAGRISISIDSTPGDGVFSLLPDRDSSEDIGILDYKQTHREVGEILARAKSAILRADAELMLSSSSSSLCAGVDACLQVLKKIQHNTVMPDHKTKSSGVLEKVDSNDVQISKWAKVHTDTSVWCILCNKSVAVDHGGVSQVNQHANTKDHKLKSDARFSTSQPKFQKAGSSVQFFNKSIDTRVIEAECLWAFKVAEEDWSFASCDHVKTLFSRMFGEAAVHNFSAGHTKMSYIVRHGLSDVLLSELVEDVNKCAGTFTILLDETTTAQVEKQCDFLVRYWSENEDQIITRYLTSTFFAHTSADELQKMVIDIFESSEIELEKFANLSTDGPNINKGLHQRLHDVLQEGSAHPGLLPFNPCILHKTHTGFHNGILVYGHDGENLAFDLHSWFKIAPCKREDFKLVTVDFQSEVIFAVFRRTEALFYRHVETRWLTLVPALQKVEERWDQAKKYFMEYLPTTKDFKKSTEQNKRYQRVVGCFKREKYLLIQLAFVVDVSTPFTSFLTVFQCEGPQIHVLYKVMKELVKTLMNRFLKPEVVTGLNGMALQKLDVKKKENQLENIEIGAKVDRLLKALPPYEQKKEKEKMLQFYVTSVQFLQKKLPFDNNILAAAMCLHPENRKRKVTVKQIEILAKKFSHVIQETEISMIKDEWKLYQAEDDGKIDVSHCRIDHYWRNIFKFQLATGEPKYGNLSKLVKSVLSLHNGNADVERSLSDNKNTCTKERIHLMHETLIGLRRMKEYARSNGGAHLIVVTPKMIEGIRAAKKKDDDRQLQERKDKEMAEKKLQNDLAKEKEKEKLIKQAGKSKKSLERRERSFLEEEQTLTDELSLAKRLMDDANKSLKDAIEKSDMLGIKVASELITSAQEKMNSITELREKLSKEQTALGKKRKSTIDSLFTNMKKSK